MNLENFRHSHHPCSKKLFNYNFFLFTHITSQYTFIRHHKYLVLSVSLLLKPNPSLLAAHSSILTPHFSILTPDILLLTQQTWHHTPPSSLFIPYLFFYRRNFFLTLKILHKAINTTHFFFLNLENRKFFTYLASICLEFFFNFFHLTSQFSHLSSNSTLITPIYSFINLHVSHIFLKKFYLI